MNKNTWHMIERLKAAGISEADAFALRRISMTLHRWHELECGGGNDYASWSIERDEVTDKPYMVTHPHTQNGTLCASFTKMELAPSYHIATGRSGQNGRLKSTGASFSRNTGLWHTSFKHKHRVSTAPGA